MNPAVVQNKYPVRVFYAGDSLGDDEFGGFRDFLGEGCLLYTSDAADEL